VQMSGKTRFWSKDLSALKRFFCDVCGSRVWNEVPRSNGRESDIGLFAASFGPNFLAAFPSSSHVFCKEAFLEIPNDGLARFDGWPLPHDLDELRRQTEKPEIE
jgi:hypothetical protein